VLRPLHLLVAASRQSNGCYGTVSTLSQGRQTQRALPRAPRAKECGRKGGEGQATQGRAADEREPSDSAELLTGDLRRRGLGRPLSHLDLEYMHLAENLVQDTFMRAFRCRERLGAAQSPRAFLYGIARHIGIDAMRRLRPVEPLVAEPLSQPEIRDPQIKRMREEIGSLPLHRPSGRDAAAPCIRTIPCRARALDDSHGIGRELGEIPAALVARTPPSSFTPNCPQQPP